MKNFFKNIKNWTFRTLGRIGSGILSVGRFLWKHKFSVLFLSVFGSAAVVLLANILTGTFAAALVVEALAAGLVLGGVEALIFGAIVLREKRLQQKELKLAKKLDESNAKKDLGNTQTNEKRYKLLKSLSNVRYKLAKASIKRTGKPMSLFEGVRFTTTRKEANLSKKYSFLKTKAELFKVRGVENGFYQFKYEWLKNHRLKRVEKAYLNNVTPEPTPAYHWCKSIKSPVDGIDELSIEKTQINCHREETYLAFKKIAQNDFFSHKRENYIKVSYSPASQLLSADARFVDKAYRNPTTKLLLTEALELAKEHGDVVFPITYTFIDSKKRGKNIKIDDMEELNQFIETLTEQTEQVADTQLNESGENQL